MALRLFNPEHDMALAAGTNGFTPPAAGRGMRRGLAFLPAFWASDGDVVVADDATLARERAATLSQWLPQVEFVTWQQVRQLSNEVEDVDPWGWDAAVRWSLLSRGIADAVMPDDEQLDLMRRLSHRAAAIELLHTLVAGDGRLVGERCHATSLEQVGDYLSRHRHVMAKAPWSCSGRGVMCLNDSLTNAQSDRLARIIMRQGGVTVEPCYGRLMDLAAEFVADGKGGVEYVGLSLFDTSHGAYMGNLLLPQETMLKALDTYGLTEQYLDVVKRLAEALGPFTADTYRGPLGVDMMVVDSFEGYVLHPCVEVNLRRTMGHVALCVARRTEYSMKVMRVVPADGYSLSIE